MADWPGMLAAPGCGRPPDTHIRREAGLEFPGRFGAFRLVSIVTNSPAGPAAPIGCRLERHPNGGLTVIVCPAPRGKLGMRMIVDDGGRPKISDNPGEVFRLTEPSARYDEEFEARLQAIPHF